MDKYNVTKKQSSFLYRLIKFIHTAFIKHKIEYWITGGTLLGAVRHGGLIPWDDDGDICIMNDQLPKLRKLKKYFSRHGYVLDQFDDQDNDKVKCCGRGKNNTDICDWYIGHKDQSLGCDIFVMMPDPKRSTKITYANPYWRNQSNGGKKCYFELDHLYPLIPQHFGNYFVYGPNNPIEHLNHCYGTSWNYQAQMLYNHRTGEWHAGTLRTMKSKEFHTIEPPKSTKCDKPPPVGRRRKMKASHARKRSSSRAPRKHSRKRSSIAQRNSSSKRSSIAQRKRSRSSR